MVQPAEELAPLEINSEDDVWNTLYTYGVKDSIGPILKFYGHRTEEEIKEDERKINVGFTQARTKDIQDFFRSLNPDQQQEALMYFLERKEKRGLILFYKSLNQPEQRKIIEKMLFEAFESRSGKQVTEGVRKLQKKLLMGRPPDNLDEAINVALRNAPGKTVLFLKENMFQIPNFLKSASEDAVDSVLLEILKYTPNYS